ncbi:hypothetical protein BH23ACT10_BH23ACT10_05360 [soil metagenome]
MGAVVAAAVAAGARHSLRHVVVAGSSMQPAVAPGDRLLLLALRGRPRVGDLVIASDPRARDRVLLKRAHAVTVEGVDVRGDNPDASTDSRAFGMLPVATVRRCVGWRYAPAGRLAYVGRRISW